MRGVHLVHLVRGVGVIGSSPHARGPLMGKKVIEIFKRIIPACAGSTYFLLIETVME